MIHGTSLSLLTFSYTFHNLSLLDHLTTPALVDLKLKPVSNAAKSWGPLQPFLEQCTNALQTINLSEVSLIEDTLPKLYARPSITEIVANAWPSATLDLPAEDVSEVWCPNLRELHVSIETEVDEDELGQMRALSVFLLKRQERGQAALRRLTIHKRSSRDVEFPYQLFEEIGLGVVCVMVPW
jgi:hypothetical protein